MGKKVKFDPKLPIKAAIVRIKIQRNKKNALIENERRIIAGLLKDGKDENARVRVEKIIKEQHTLDAYEELYIHLEELLQRAQSLKASNGLPEDLREGVCTVIFASPRVKIAELTTLREQFTVKYGQLILQDAFLNRNDCINPKVFQCLSVSPPSEAEVLLLLNEIAKQHGVAWEADV
eukprot:TRINITY_DN5652_c0_g1_i2.p1 TRINITY_DN5652_c0_g1~~TRINITY_DN5652_c0_g1_i2.p1  ORF type:complete len:190 (+),score=53.11 TRINITY_DN5652_c0_g1_i2:38-571(+)